MTKQVVAQRTRAENIYVANDETSRANGGQQLDIPVPSVHCPSLEFGSEVLKESCLPGLVDLLKFWEVSMKLHNVS